MSEHEAVKLGGKYTDPVTGFTGTATGRAEYLHGCARVMLEGKDADGNPKDVWTDEPRLTPE